MFSTHSMKYIWYSPQKSKYPLYIVPVKQTSNSPSQPGPTNKCLLLNLYRFVTPSTSKSTFSSAWEHPEFEEPGMTITSLILLFFLPTLQRLNGLLPGLLSGQVANTVSPSQLPGNMCYKIYILISEHHLSETAFFEISLF